MESKPSDVKGEKLAVLSVNDGAVWMVVWMAS